jgi:hypothetical protein
VVVFTLEAFGQLSGCCDPFKSVLGSNRSNICMTSFKIYEENAERGRTTSFQIVIEAKGLSDSETRLWLRVDTHLIAKNLTAAQMKFLFGEILDRIACSEGEDEAESVKRQLH